MSAALLPHRVARYHAARIIRQAVGRGDFALPGLAPDEVVEAERAAEQVAARLACHLRTERERQILNVPAVVAAGGVS